ncbi:MAG: tungsten ABC transporter permease [Burkholderiaceae bacterium]|nr:tungsten ABC transporter permease [Burkholderiaceae bacterium]
MPTTGSELSRRTFALVAGASAVAWGLPAGAAAVATDSRPAVRVAAVGGLALCGVWPLLAAQAGQDLGLNVETAAASPKEGVLPVFAQGDAEVLLIHASDEAMGLEAAGLAGPARVWAWNEQAVIGPRADPARVAQARDGLDAMRRIAQAQAPFIAFRDPGSYTVVQRLWRRAGIRADAAWVRMDTAPTPQAVLRQASEQQAYVVAGHIPWAFGKMAAPGMQLLLRGDPHMRRPYVVLTPGPQHGASANARRHAQRLAEYLVSPTGQAALRAADHRAGGPWLFARDSVPFVAGETP